jgi:DNA-binding response OmpR family regulator
MDGKRIRIIVVEDQPILRSEIVSNLCAEGFETFGVKDGAELYFELLHGPADIVILDMGLPGQNGVLVVQQLRSIQNMQSLGIIMLTAQSEPRDGLDSLANGADIFLVKPFEFDELVAYVQSLYRRMQRGHELRTSLTWQFQQTEWRLVCPSGTLIELSHLEAAFLGIVGKNAGKPVRRRDIISIAFGKDPFSYDPRRLEAVVSRLRRKIHLQYPLSQPIKVVHSIGYVFTDAIRCI